MRHLKISFIAFVLVSMCSIASAQVFTEDFESYTSGSPLHGQGGWKGWDNVASAGAPTSDTYAFSGTNSVEIIGAADLVHEFDITGGRWELTAMQYIPSGTSGTTWFILLNTYNEPDGATKDWSVQTQFNLATGAITSQYDSSASAVIVYDQWVQIKCMIDLDNNTVDEYYNGEFFSTHQWDDGNKNTLQVIDLYGNSASSVYYDDIVVMAPPGAYKPEPADGAIHTAMWATLKWGPGAGAVSHDVYLSDSLDDVNDRTAEAFIGNQMATSLVVGFFGFPFPDGLVPGTTYYWRIDEVGADGTITDRGDVWSFMVPPTTAYAPDPADGGQYILANAQLNWTDGFNAKLHTVYFGETFDDVNSASAGPSQVFTTYDPGPLEKGKTYYWRIDEFDGLQLIKGNVWSFTTEPVIPVHSDPDLVALWTFDEGQGSTALDWSGHGNNVTLVGPKWAGTGLLGDSALSMSGGYGAIQNLSYAATDLTEVTVSAWVRTPIPNDQYIISFDRNEYWRLEINGNGAGPGQVGWDVMTSSGQVDYGSATRVDDGTWHHVCGVYDNGRLTIYIDGIAEASAAGGPTCGSGNTRYGFIGANSEAGGFNGSRGSGAPVAGDVDDIRIYSKALTQDEIVLVMRGDPMLAWAPNPPDGSTPDVGRAVPLTWSAGDSASSHDVYFGADADAVKNADTSDTTGTYRGRQNVTTFTPAEALEWGSGPFYWRIDENNTDGTITKGKVWTFSVADFILVDDFESYNNIDITDPASNSIFASWVDGYQIPTNGAITAEEMPPYAEQTIVRSGRQSMKYVYNTNLMISESTLTLVYPKDWTEQGVAELSLWFRGDAGNAPERMYVALNGTAVKYHDDPAATQITGWTQWVIPLQVFADQGLALTNVSTMTIGFGDRNPASAGSMGTVYFDDIRLDRP